MAGSIDSTIDSRNSSRAAHASAAVHDSAIEATQEEGQWQNAAGSVFRVSPDVFKAKSFAAHEEK